MGNASTVALLNKKTAQKLRVNQQTSDAILFSNHLS